MASLSVVLTLYLGVAGALVVHKDNISPEVQSFMKESGSSALPSEVQSPSTPDTGFFFGSQKVSIGSVGATDLWSFVSNDARQCIEGAPETVESALALKKAGLTGELYNSTFALTGGCQKRGYTMGFGTEAIDDCHPDVTVFYKDQPAMNFFKTSKEWAIREYANRWNLTEDKATKMHKCTCHPQSWNMNTVDMECSDVLNGMSGSWVHHDAKDQSGLMCDGGPFLEATLALAIIKSTGQLPMHEHDQIAPVTCDKLGFPSMHPTIDHCFKGLHMWSRTANFADPMADPGMARSADVEKEIFSGNLTTGSISMSRFILDHHLNSKVLNGKPGCHCSPDSEVVGMLTMGGGKAAYDSQCLQHTSPIRLWWKDTTF